MRKFNIEKTRVNGEVVSENLSAFTPDLLETSKILDFEQVNATCIKWSNKMQYDAQLAKKEYKDWDSEKLADLRKQEMVSWKETTQFERAICIGAKWSFGKFGVPEWFSTVSDAMRKFIRQETDENKKALADACNTAFNNLAKGHVPADFSFKLSNNQSAKLAYACYPARAKTDSKKEVSYILENRLSIEKCYEQFCVRFVSLLGIAKNTETKTKTVSYMA